MKWWWRSTHLRTSFFSTLKEAVFLMFRASFSRGSTRAALWMSTADVSQWKMLALLLLASMGSVHVAFCHCSQVQSQLRMDTPAPGLLLWTQGCCGGIAQGKCSLLLHLSCPVHVCEASESYSMGHICRQVLMQICRTAWVTHLYTKQPTLGER